MDTALSDEAVIQLAISGHGARALQLSEAKVADAVARQGEASGAHGEALFLLSQVCFALDLLPRAVGTLRKATEIRTGKPEDERNRLTYLMNLADFLAASGQLEEALEVQQRSVDGRRAFYGVEHPGYAFGLDGWAGVALSLGRYKEATRAAGEALTIYQRHRHPRVTRALAFLMLAAAGDGGRVEAKLPPQAAIEVMDALIGRDIAPKASVLATAMGWAEADVPSPRDRINPWVVVHRRASAQQDHATAALAMQKLLALAEATHDGNLALDAELGLALAFEGQGDASKAAARYESAVARGRSLGLAAQVKALNNAGLFFANGGDAPRGRALLKEAVALNAPGDEGGRAHVALGLYLQHQGDRQGAKAQLLAAIDKLNPAHPDALCAQSHLKAIESGDGCGCGAPGDAFDAQLARMVRERAPEGVLANVVVKGGEVSLYTARDLSHAEGRQLADVVELARAELRQRIRQVYG